MAKKNWINLERQLKKRKSKTHNDKTKKVTPGTFIGYDIKDENPCMIAQVTSEHLEAFKKENITKFKINDWFVSFGQDHDLKFSDPFASHIEAFEYCKNILHTKRFTSLPIFES